MAHRPQRQRGQRLRLSALLATAALAGSMARAEGSIGLGRPVDAATVAALAITVFPDGRGLPPGQGSVEQGRALYVERCAACHGDRGREGPAARLAGSDGFIAWNDLLRPLRIRQYPILMISVGALWPHATTIFDYVRRAMPHGAPKSLSDDQCYALTAYVLHLNGLLPATATVSQRSLPAVAMPGAARTVLRPD